MKRVREDLLLLKNSEVNSHPLSLNSVQDSLCVSLSSQPFYKLNRVKCFHEHKQETFVCYFSKSVNGFHHRMSGFIELLWGGSAINGQRRVVPTLDSQTDRWHVFLGAHFSWCTLIVAWISWGMNCWSQVLLCVHSQMTIYRRVPSRAHRVANPSKEASVGRPDSWGVTHGLETEARAEIKPLFFSFFVLCEAQVPLFTHEKTQRVLTTNSLTCREPCAKNYWI